MTTAGDDGSAHPAHYDDPVLIELYDLEATSYGYLDAFTGFAGPADQRILDIGCGTGTLALKFAQLGHRVIGLDPAPGMIAAARAKSGASSVQFVIADARNFSLDSHFDLVTMTGNAFQALHQAGAQAEAIASVAQHLAPGGRFVFDTRNPDAREWLEWTEATSKICLDHPQLGAVDVWWEAAEIEPDRLIALSTHYRFADGRRAISHSRLRFTPPDEIKAMAETAGLAVETINAGVAGRPFTGGEPQLLVVLRKS